MTTQADDELWSAIADPSRRRVLDLLVSNGAVSASWLGGGLFHLVCYVRDGDRVFETYWTTGRGVEAMDYSYALMDLTVYGRQERWEDSPAGWPQPWPVDGHTTRIDGRPIAQWPRLAAGRSDDLGPAATATGPEHCH
jgi:hypothetical protein